MHLKSLHDNTVKRLADLTLKRLDSILEMTTRCISVHADSQHCIAAAVCVWSCWMDQMLVCLFPLVQPRLHLGEPIIRARQATL